ncbi:uncharacterized protein EDB91DRAFT_1276361 [Suillus paluster]|uniref:uncharacterized protein n=1 Tax=Suillus paluster TaxID=48578 RepID=UPI001B863BDC|nr:uncharacterized protein EDB91DRAFT_1276361 [Suillus paluster]KAG1754881.1 hypothetical protein EDB91DRAFT_1276361 [Suillus paluster]
MSSTQLMRLESIYQRDTHPSRQRKTQLVDELGLDYKTITIWFQNKRQVAKRSPPGVSSIPLQIRNGVSQTPDHQHALQSPSVLRRVSSAIGERHSTARDSAIGLKQGKDVDKSPLKKSLQVKPLLTSLGSFISSKPPKASHGKDQVQPTVASKTSAKELWQHLPSSPTAPSSVSDRGGEACSTARDENDTPCSKRGLTLEWACDRQTKRRRGGIDNSSDTDGSSRLWFGSSSRRTGSALSLLSLATGRISTSLPAGPTPSQDVIHGASLLLSFKHSLRGCDAGNKQV